LHLPEPEAAGDPSGAQKMKRIIVLCLSHR